MGIVQLCETRTNEEVKIKVYFIDPKATCCIMTIKELLVIADIFISIQHQDDNITLTVMIDKNQWRRVTILAGGCKRRKTIFYRQKLFCYIKILL